MALQYGMEDDNIFRGLTNFLGQNVSLHSRKTVIECGAMYDLLEVMFSFI